MSPASQGNLEVERYIGSCLISARSNNNNSSKSTGASGNNHQQQHQQANFKPKKVGNGEGGSGNNNNNSVPRGGRLQSRPLLGCPHHGYAPPGSMIPMCDCPRYGSPGHTTPGGGGWAGMPLISMANNSRRNRKPASNGPQRNSNNVNAKPVAQLGEGDPNLRTPLSRLAIHTQGAPLILAGHYNARKNNNNGGHRGPGRQFKAELPGRRCNGGEVSRDMRGSGSSNNTPNSDCLSVASDESSGHSENSLPRIIKPRKRRKKDRKPPASPSTGATNNTSESDPSSELSGIVTLKPYVPLCHELYDNHRGGGRRRDEVEAKWVPEVRRDDEKKIVHGTEEVVKDGCKETDVEDDVIPLNTLFPYPCLPSTCQCRYCDPVGQIWDVDQHCYSPFLTPPSLDLSFPETSYVSIPLFLTPPPETKTFDFFNRDFKDSSSNVTDCDHKEAVRRSWSEPSASYSDNEDVRGSLTDFGVIGGGRTSDGGSRNARKDGTRHTSTSSESSTVSSLSQSLDVSTEIVTSLNGHRDIEIKFFSSSPPSVMVDVIGEFGGCETVDSNNWGGTKVLQHELWNTDSPVFTEERGHTDLMSVWGNPNRGEVEDGNRNLGNKWGNSWPVRQQQVGDIEHDKSSKILSDEVNQLCLQNVEE